ncbi:hypothetical protein [Collimonas sp. PA-H2]|uniref:hypothetical protein n=1 Tax=Collimonas sp. PA-H2 TaxID=1881062 RepID=UPI001304705D|nr:hypothetical protein [Collimonas sp. PA-H2]
MLFSDSVPLATGVVGVVAVPGGATGGVGVVAVPGGVAGEVGVVTVPGGVGAVDVPGLGATAVLDVPELLAPSPPPQADNSNERVAAAASE